MRRLLHEKILLFLLLTDGRQRGAESAHPIIGDVRIKYVSVYPDGKVTSWSEGAGDPGAIGSI